MDLNFKLIAIIVLIIIDILLLYSLYTRICCLILKYRYKKKVHEWRDKLLPGEEIMVEEHITQRRTIVAIKGNIVQVRNTEGNLSGHHISTIYPIIRDHGKSN